MTPSLAILCATAKPHGPSGRSAVRSLLLLARQGALDAKYQVNWIDMKETPIIGFDGRSLARVHDDTHLTMLYQALSDSDGVVFGCPAYWGGIGGVAKNVLDWLGGEAFSSSYANATPIGGKPVNSIVVCGQAIDLEPSRTQLVHLWARLGAVSLPQRDVYVENPTDQSRTKEAVIEAYRLGKKFFEK